MSLPRCTLATLLLLSCGTDDPGSGAADGGTMDGAAEVDRPGDASVAADAAPARRCAAIFAAGRASSSWARYDDSGKLVYATLPAGDRMLDFSHAGYMGGGVAIPELPVRATVSPSGGDDTVAIQAAIDAVSARPPEAGVRGAVLLSAGTFEVRETLEIGKSGVVLRGSGSGQGRAPGDDSGATVIQLTGDPHRFLRITGAGSLSTTGAGAAITDAYVPAGASTIHVDDASGFAVGDAVVVDRPVTEAWVHAMKMDTLVRNGEPQTWLSTSAHIRADRIVAAIAGDAITLDAPLADSYDAALLSPPGAKLFRYKFAGRISQVGVEHLRVVAPAGSAPIDEDNFGFVRLEAVVDGWVRDVVGQDCLDGLSVGGGTKRITIEDVALVQTAPSDTGAGAPAQYAISGTQVLLQRSSSVVDKSFAVVTQAQVTGPNVVLDFTGSGSGPHIQPHQRWATGLLVDGATLSGGNLELMNRGNLGSGHGWTMGWGVAWNSSAGSLVIQQPPGSTNWAIGCTGTPKTRAQPGSSDSTPLPSGIFDSHGMPVTPSSLYLAQLCERLGPQALANIGYPVAP